MGCDSYGPVPATPHQRESPTELTQPDRQFAAVYQRPVQLNVASTGANVQSNAWRLRRSRRGLGQPCSNETTELSRRQSLNTVQPRPPTPGVRALTLQRQKRHPIGLGKYLDLQPTGQVGLHLLQTPLKPFSIRYHLASPAVAMAERYSASASGG